MFRKFVENSARKLTITNKGDLRETWEKGVHNACISYQFPQAGKSPMPVVSAPREGVGHRADRSRSSPRSEVGPTSTIIPSRRRKCFATVLAVSQPCHSPPRMRSPLGLHKPCDLPRAPPAPAVALLWPCIRVSVRGELPSS